MENYYEDTINLKDLFFYVVKQWKKILIGALIGLLIGCGFSVFKMYESTPENVLKRLNNLDDSEINENNILQYADYNAIYEKEIEYSKKSILMNLNSNSVYSGELSFSYSALDKDIKNIENYYDGLLDNNINLLVKLFDNKYEASYVKELIDFDFVTDNSNSIKTSSDVHSSGNLKIKVIGESEDFVQIILNKLYELIQEANNETLKNYSFVTANEDKNSIVFGYNYDVLKKQTDKINARQSLLNSLTNAKSKLSSNELLYYSYYYDYDDAFANYQLGFSKKWPVLFAVGLAVVVAGVYFLLYLFDDHIKSFDEIKDRYKLPLLGTLKVTDKEYKNVIDKFINDLDKKEYNNLDYIKSSIKLLDNKSIMLCNEYDELNKEFDRLDSRIDVSGTLNNDTKSLDKLKKADGVILVSKLWESKNSDIQRQIDIVNNAGKKIVGVIGLE